MSAIKTTSMSSTTRRDTSTTKKNSNTLLLRAIEYDITSEVVDGNDDCDAASLAIHVQDSLTTESWSGNFSRSYIENMTHRTGSFRHFSVFVRMISSAVSKKSNTVTLDLLTYADLQTLRNSQRAENSTGIRSNASSEHKRYLIVTHVGEFDRISYPLPLQFHDPPDPDAVRETVRRLRDEITHLSERKGNNIIQESGTATGIGIEKRSNPKQKLKIQQSFAQQDLIVTENTALGGVPKKEDIQQLKSLLGSAEERLLVERERHKRNMRKLQTETAALRTELNDCRLSERQWREKCKVLSSDLASIKRRNSLAQNYYSRSSPVPVRQRSTKPSPASSTGSRARSARPRSRSASPATTSRLRFDPTAYVREKERKQRTSSANRPQRRSRTRSTNPGANRSRSSSVDSVCSSSSRASLRRNYDRPWINNSVLNHSHEDREYNADNIDVCISQNSPSSKRSNSASDARLNVNSPPLTASALLKKDSSDKWNNYNSKAHRNYLEASTEITDIDARLSALQAFLANGK